MKKNIVFYSGGKGSFVAAKRVIEKHGKDNVILLFSDTKIEHEDLYRFLDETGEFLGVEVTTIEDGRTPWQVFKDAKYIGGTRGARCSIELKRLVARKWIEERFEKDEVVLHFGIDVFEKERTKGIGRQWQDYDCQYPLMWQPWATYSTVIDEVKKSGIEMPAMYLLGFSHNNCGGFCVKAGLSHYANVLKTMPEKYLQYEKEEAEVYEHIGAVRPFLRKMVDGITEYITLKQYRKHI